MSWRIVSRHRGRAHGFIERLEWMRAGGGTWHRGTIQPAGERAEGFQLWIALPPALEEGPSECRARRR